MRSAFSEFWPLIIALVAVAIALVPNFRSRNRVILVVAAVFTLGLTAFGYWLHAYTGLGLFERAACVVFADGPYCRGDAARPGPAPVRGNQDDLAQVPAGYGFRECEACPSMLIAAGGTFLMGSPVEQTDGYHSERPQHQVRVPRFALGRYEVTGAEWNACVRADACAARRTAQGDRYPVTGVTWEDTQDYISWLNTQVAAPLYRLPTESEWEYAARAGTTAQFYWGASASDGCAFANMWDSTTSSDEQTAEYVTCSDGYPHGLAPVGHYRPNRFRFYDMIGNAWEWVEDCYVPGYQGAPTDGSARQAVMCESHVLRGGSRITYPRSMRVSFRGRDTGEYTISPIGFRIARSIPTAAPS